MVMGIYEAWQDNHVAAIYHFEITLGQTGRVDLIRDPAYPVALDEYVLAGEFLAAGVEDQHVRKEDQIPASLNAR
jgi:hypothetical protein